MTTEEAKELAKIAEWCREEAGKIMCTIHKVRLLGRTKSIYTVSSAGSDDFRAAICTAECPECSLTVSLVYGPSDEDKK